MLWLPFEKPSLRAFQKHVTSLIFWGPIFSIIIEQWGCVRLQPNIFGHPSLWWPKSFGRHTRGNVICFWKDLDEGFAKTYDMPPICSMFKFILHPFRITIQKGKLKKLATYSKNTKWSLGVVAFSSKVGNFSSSSSIENNNIVKF